MAAQCTLSQRKVCHVSKQTVKRLAQMKWDYNYARAYCDTFDESLHTTFCCPKRVCHYDRRRTYKANYKNARPALVHVAQVSWCD